MSKTRRWWIGGLAMWLLLTTGPAAHAQESPADPFGAPKHLASLLPDAVEGQDLIVFGLPPGPLSEQFWMSVWVDPGMNVLPRLGKTAADMRFAMATDLSEPPLAVLAVQVAGVPADDVMQAAIQGLDDAAEAAGSTFPSTLPVRTEDIDGDRVHVVEFSEVGSAILFYPVGEALFVIPVPAYQGAVTGRIAELLSTLRDGVARAQRPSTHPQTRRFELSDIGIAVTLPGDWRQTLEGTELDDDARFDDARIFVSPDGFFRYCLFGARRFEGRVTTDFVEDFVAPELVDPKIWSRVPTAAGEAVRSLERQTNSGFLPGLASASARYFFPSGDSMIVAGCAAGHEEGQGPDEDWRHVVDSIEFLDTGPTVADATLATRDLVCSILVPRPSSSDEIKAALRAMPRPSPGDVRREVRRFLRRHGKEVLGSASPGTMTRSGELTYSSAWSTVPFVRPEVDRSLKELGGNERKAWRAASRLMRWFVGVYGAFDDPAIRGHARRVSELTYHFGVTGPPGDKERNWSRMNSNIDVHARIQGLGSCFAPDGETVPPAAAEEFAVPAAANDDGADGAGASVPMNRLGEGLTIGYITPKDLPLPGVETIKAGMISAADAAGVKLLVCEANFVSVHVCAEAMVEAGLDGVIQYDWDFKPKRTCRALKGIPTIVVAAQPELGMQDCWTALIGPDNGEAGRLVGDAIGRYASERWGCEFDAYVSLERKPSFGPVGVAIADGMRDGFRTWCRIPRKREHVFIDWVDDKVFEGRMRRMAREVQGDRLVIVGSTTAIGVAEQSLAEADRTEDGFFSGLGTLPETPLAIACGSQFIASVDPRFEERYAELAMTAMVDHLRGEEIASEILLDPQVVDASNVRDAYPDTPSC